MRGASVAQALLQEEPDARPTALDSLSHPWLKLDSATHAAAAPLGASIVQRLQRFGTYGRLQQVALRAVRVPLPGGEGACL